MQKMRILNRFGMWECIEWDYDPEKNPAALRKAVEKLTDLGIASYEITEVAPEIFWYSTPESPLNCALYKQEK
jgi:hypothetical protein